MSKCYIHTLSSGRSSQGTPFWLWNIRKSIGGIWEKISLQDKKVHMRRVYLSPYLLPASYIWKQLYEDMMPQATAAILQLRDKKNWRPKVSMLWRIEWRMKTARFSMTLLRPLIQNHLYLQRTFYVNKNPHLIISATLASYSITCGQKHCNR